MTLYQKLDDWEDRLIEGLIEDVILTADLQDARIIKKLPTRDARFMTSFPLLPPANDEFKPIEKIDVTDDSTCGFDPGQVVFSIL